MAETRARTIEEVTGSGCRAPQREGNCPSALLLQPASPMRVEAKIYSLGM